MTDKEFQISPSFLTIGQRKIFTVRFVPEASPIASILFFPPFAEEMHKSRRTVAEHGYTN